ncbi:glycosyltransferase family 4 protein [bacterium]|nr:glycosyltransferase family 4 protein [bacterium]
MIKILGVFNEITNTTIPIENFNQLSQADYEKHAFAYSTRASEADQVVKDFPGGSIDRIIAVGDFSKYRKIRDLSRLIQKQDYDIIHIHHTVSSILVILISLLWKPRAKIVFTVHNDYKYYKWYQKIVFKVVLNSADFIICNSNNTKKSIQKIVNGENISVIYNGVNLKNIPRPPEATSNSIKLLFAGRLVPQKNIFLLLRAIEKLIKEGHRFKFFLVGDGPQRTEVEEFITKSGIENQVEIFGKLKRAEVYDLMNLADVFIVPSVFEGFCNAMVEAMLCRCIIVASKVEPLPEVTGGSENAVFFELNEPDQLFKNLKNILLDLQSYQDLNRKSEQYARSRYSLDRCANRHSELYKKLGQC